MNITDEELEKIIKFIENNDNNQIVFCQETILPILHELKELREKGDNNGKQHRA